MREPVGEEDGERAAAGDDLDVACTGPRAEVQPERAAVRRLPGLVEIEDERQHARIVVAEPVDVNRIRCAGRVHREVQLDLDCAELQIAVHRLAEPLEARKHDVQRRTRAGFIQPQGLVAPYRRFDAPVAADACGAERAGRPLAPNLAGQRGHQGRGKPLRSSAPALVLELIDDEVDGGKRGFHAGRAAGTRQPRSSRRQSGTGTL